MQIQWLSLPMRGESGTCYIMAMHIMLILVGLAPLQLGDIDAEMTDDFIVARTWTITGFSLIQCSVFTEQVFTEQHVPNPTCSPHGTNSKLVSVASHGVACLHATSHGVEVSAGYVQPLLVLMAFHVDDGQTRLETGFWRACASG